MSPDELDHWFEVMIAIAAVALFVIYERNDTVRNEVSAWSLMAAMIFAAMELGLNSRLTHSSCMSIAGLCISKNASGLVKGKETLEVTDGQSHVRNSVASHEANPPPML